MAQAYRCCLLCGRATRERRAAYCPRCAARERAAYARLAWLAVLDGLHPLAVYLLVILALVAGTYAWGGR